MRTARVVSYKKPKRFRGQLAIRLMPFIFIILLRGTIAISPLVFGAYYIYINGMPYMLWEYRYRGSKEYPVITSCTYFGYDGMRSFPASECPFISFMKSTSRTTAE